MTSNEMNEEKLIIFYFEQIFSRNKTGASNVQTLVILKNIKNYCSLCLEGCI
jgi:hypothetical protein